ncbi:MFS transporter, OFA family, oxalate/formate antiporter [Salegentibacter holothuriorum]|uniref:MFS transporter, OFA family, oxalate/formate antiporter n=1 Tax=Salegentibacter holothuriorum TaxID=241145 RepID=A0A1T5D0P3_9FLAO|nr:OFA family MFS transporter [Salegentibacter holothuriorum]SKB65183.1 MFS transporter, OFA family, oxalate/formate antiporter [Salegentibacter holothuriorum]
MDKVKNRWLIAASAVGIHISIGSVYAWSVYTKPLIEKFGWELADTQFTFSLAIFFLGISAAFLGHYLEKKGPRKSGLLAAIFFGVGILGSGVAIHLESIYLLYLFYGVFGGVGLGLGYITPVSTLVKWFPDKRGLATGLAIMGFGFAALISSPVIVYLISAVGIANTFFIMGSIYFVLILVSSLYLAPPPKDWMPEGFKDIAKSGKKVVKADLSQLTANEAVKTKRFWYLWLMLFINISCGIAIISVASPMAQEYAGMGVVAAATMVGIMGLFNGAGRIGWATLSDFIGRPMMFALFFTIQIVAFFLLPTAGNAIIFQALIFLILSCYGGGFSTVPAYIGDMFGTKELGAIHGYILTAWAAAGMAGPLFAAWARSISDSYNGTLYFFAGLLVIALFLSVLTILEIRKLKKGKIATPSKNQTEAVLS